MPPCSISCGAEARPANSRRKQTIQKALALMAEKGRFERLLKVADSEPPRVRAMLGAIGEQLGKNPAALQRCATSLNPFSRFDFGLLAGIADTLTKWQAKEPASVKLFEHPDFEQAILQAAEHFRRAGLRPAIIEKGLLRHRGAAQSSAAHRRRQVIFKGGTSLSKGWNLIQRFSEDIDIFLDPLAFNPALGKRRHRPRTEEAARRRWRTPGADLCRGGEPDHRRIRAQRPLLLQQRFGGPGEVANRVLLEAGTASGREPTTVVELQLLPRPIPEGNEAFLSVRKTRGRFHMRLLHFRRTFVEKMFAIHSKVELLKRDGQPLGTYATALLRPLSSCRTAGSDRHAEVREYAAIKADYDQISRAHFAKSYFCPEDMASPRATRYFRLPDLAADHRRRIRSAMSDALLRSVSRLG